MKELRDALGAIKSRFLRFDVIPMSGMAFLSTEVGVYSRHGGELGRIEYCVAWADWVFAPGPSVIFSTDCMNDVIVAIEVMRQGQKKAHRG